MASPPIPSTPPPLPPRPSSGWRVFGMILLWTFAVIGFGATLCTATLLFSESF